MAKQAAKASPKKICPRVDKEKALVSALTQSQDISADARFLTKCVIEEFGGHEGLAKALKVTYDQGVSAVKARVINDVMRLIQQVTQGDENIDISGDQEALEAAIKSELGKYNADAGPVDESSPEGSEADSG